MASAVRLLHPALVRSHVQVSSPHRSGFFILNDRKNTKGFFSRHSEFSGEQHKLTPVVKSSRQNDDFLSSDNEEDGVSLGTLKLPENIDFQRFESLLFQWANSLCQGANLPLPVPLKIDVRIKRLETSCLDILDVADQGDLLVDKIPGGVRLGFITVGDGKTEVLVHIDCSVFPSSSGSGPIFRAIRNGPLKDKSPPGEPRIMRSLLEALKTSVDIARV